MIYLDSAATSLLKPKSVEKAMVAAMQTMASPGRGAHSAAMLAADKVYECRELACRLFNVSDPERVVFTMNATHALNIAIRSMAKRGDRVVISGYEHNSVTRVLYDIGAEVVAVKTPLFDSAAAIEGFRNQIPSASLVVCNHVSNVFGFKLPVQEIALICRENNVPLIIDASQSAGIDNIDFAGLGAAYIAMPGHKGLLGPQGTGILLCGDVPAPLMSGGTGSDSLEQNMPEYLPDRVEAGTHNVVGIAGLTEGMRYVLNHGAVSIGAYEERLCRRMAEKLQGIRSLEVFSALNGAQAGVLSIRHKSINPEAFCAELGRRGVAARCGLHCAPLAHETAGTLNTGTVRLSFSPFITTEQINSAFRVIESITNTEI